MAMAQIPVINVLRRGQESADKLTALLEQHKLPPEVMHLLENISGAFSEVVAMSQNVVAASPDHQPLPSTGENGMCTNSRKKRRSTEVAPKYGGRKRADPHSCKKVLKETVDDGFTWRKYGQKEIFSAKHPRNYYRCTHKNDEKCLATRQVQQSEQQPNMYDITYFGEHTCKQAKIKRCQEQENSYVINFDCNTNNPIQHISSSPPLSSSIKHENDEEVMSNQISSGSCFTTSPGQQLILSDFFDLGSIDPSNSFSMEINNSHLELGHNESIFSDSQFEFLLQGIES